MLNLPPGKSMTKNPDLIPIFMLHFSWVKQTFLKYRKNSPPIAFFIFPSLLKVAILYSTQLLDKNMKSEKYWVKSGFSILAPHRNHMGSSQNNPMSRPPPPQASYVRRPGAGPRYLFLIFSKRVQCAANVENLQDSWVNWMRCVLGHQKSS